MACDARPATRAQTFGVAHIVSYLSRFMALQAGDVIATGTPPGVRCRESAAHAKRRQISPG